MQHYVVVPHQKTNYLKYLQRNSDMIRYRFLDGYYCVRIAERTANKKRWNTDVDTICSAVDRSYRGDIYKMCEWCAAFRDPTFRLLLEEEGKAINQEILYMPVSIKYIRKVLQVFHPHSVVTK